MKNRNSNHYSKKKLFRFYCLILYEDGTNYLYVGKTTGLRMSAVYSRHIRGHVAATDCYFEDEKPQFHILSEHILTTAEAYKYVVAYVCLFQAHGYVCINHTGTLAHAEQPNPETLTIIRVLESEPVEVLLERTLVERPADADHKPPSAPAKKESTIQMNIRILPSDKLLFDHFRAEQKLNQQEAFSLLLDQTDNRHYTNLLTKKEEKIQKLERENEILRQKLTQQRVPSIPNAVLHARDFLQFAKKGLAVYEASLPIPSDVQPLPRHSYRHFIKKLLDGPPYEYPASEGFSVLSLEKVLWSNRRTKACFLLGTDPESRRVKLRYYPKEIRLTCSFLDSLHAYPDAKWLVGYRPAKDHAMELVLAIPLGSVQGPPAEQQTVQSGGSRKVEQKLSLDEQIHYFAKGQP